MSDSPSTSSSCPTPKVSSSTNSSSDKKLFVGVYKHGIADVCFLELEAANANIFYHNLAHQLMVFSLPVPLADRPRPAGTSGTRVSLGQGCFREELPMCFDAIFEPIHSYGRDLQQLTALGVNDDDSSGSLDNLLHRVLFRSSHVVPLIENKLCGRNQKIAVKKRRSNPAARESAREMLTKIIEAERANWDRAIDRPWRVTAEKIGDHGVSSVELGQSFGEIGAEYIRERGEADQGRAPVRMLDYELEVLILLSHPGSRETSEHGKTPTPTEMNSSATTTAVSYPRVLRTDIGDMDEDLWCFGIRLRRPSLLEKRGVEVMKTNFSVAASLCLLMLREQLSNSLTLSGLTMLDPMCGHGTLPLVMHLMQQKTGWKLSNVANKRRRTGERDDQEDDVENHHADLAPLTPLTVIGCDAKDLSYAEDISKHFGDSLRFCPTPTAIRIRPPVASWIGSADTCRLQLHDSTIDCVIVDPPWGQRHGSHKFVEKNLRKWLFEWRRVLKAGGLLGIVTIRTKQMLRELTIEPFASNMMPVEGFPLMFNNCGYPQCMFFLLRKIG